MHLCRDNVGLPGLAKYFKDGSDEERDHAQLLISFQVSPSIEVVKSVSDECLSGKLLQQVFQAAHCKIR